MARTRVARTRLTPDEYDEFEAAAAEAGVKPAEHLRNLIITYRRGARELESEIASIKKRLEHVESEVARMWAQEGQHDQ